MKLLIKKESGDETIYMEYLYLFFGILNHGL